MDTISAYLYIYPKKFWSYSNEKNMHSSNHFMRFWLFLFIAIWQSKHTYFVRWLSTVWSYLHIFTKVMLVKFRVLKLISRTTKEVFFPRWGTKKSKSLSVWVFIPKIIYTKCALFRFQTCNKYWILQRK